jgi:WD40 repeat protein
VRLAILLILLAFLTAECQAQNQAPPITALAVTPDGAHVLTGSQSGVSVLAWPELKETTKLATALDQVNDLAFSPDGKQLLIAGGAPSESGGIEIWSWPDSKLVAKASPHSDLIYQAAWSERGERIVTASADGTAKVLDAKSPSALTTYSGHSRSILAATWVHGDASAITAGVDQTIQLWGPKTGRPTRTLSNHVGTVNALAFRPTSGDAAPILASVSDDRTVRIWQPLVGRLMRFAKLPSPPRAVVWLRSGDYLAVGCNDGAVRFLDFDELKIVKEIPGEVGRIHAVCLHPKEAKLLVGGARGVRAVALPDLAAK